MGVEFAFEEGGAAFGVTDVFYYVSPEGEDHVRATVYHQVLSQLADYKDHPDVHLHLIGHSLGVTLTPKETAWLNLERARP